MFEKQVAFIGRWGWNILRGSFFWLIGNFIYLFLLLNGLVAENKNEIGTLFLTSIILIPFVFAPGTVAAFSCVRTFFMEEKSVNFSFYKKSYQQNYKIASQHGFFFLIILFILYAAYWYYGRFHLLGQWLPLFLMVVVSVLFLFILMYTSDRKEKFLDYWKLGSLILVNHPMFTIFMGSEIFFILYFCHFIGGLLLFVAPGAILIVVHYFYGESVSAELKKLNI